MEEPPKPTSALQHPYNASTSLAESEVFRTLPTCAEKRGHLLGTILEETLKL